MMSHDPEGKMGPKMQLPDNVIVHEPKEEVPMMMPQEGVSHLESYPVDRCTNFCYE